MGTSPLANLIVSMIFAVASLSFTTPVSAGKIRNCDPPEEPLGLPVCADSDATYCFASIGKWHPTTFTDPNDEAHKIQCDSLFSGQ